MNRANWTSLSDAELLAQCEVDTYRASGPGGQKRNKTSSAVRLRHLPSKLMTIAEESRSQHENKAKALKRLRQKFWLVLREPLPALAPEDLTLHLVRKDPRFWPTVGLVLDCLAQFEAQVSTSADWLNTTTGNLIDFLEIEDMVWTEANRLRQRAGLGLLRQG
ncbi:MAG TPA: peptide chain release factor-like protein [Gemmatales bacterium]|nr:peptide chain release factor-like protein [Gemmatales bacterium]HMP17446.1 peptide chain release factor-like protein [Gemmatales bacterium]